MGLGYALFISLVCTFFDWSSYGIYIPATQHPVVCGALTGLLMGDVSTGVLIGGTLELVYMGIIGVGAAIPVNKVTATCVSVALCITTGISTEAAIGLAVPVAVMGQLSNIAAWLINAPLMHKADSLAAEDKLSQITTYTLVGKIVFFIVKFIPVFLCIYFGSPVVEAFNNNMPTWVNSWLSTSKGMLPALGFGMLFSMMNKPKYIPYFILGYVLCAVFGGSLLSVSLVGIALALIHFFESSNQSVQLARRRED